VKLIDNSGGMENKKNKQNIGDYSELDNLIKVADKMQWCACALSSELIEGKYPGTNCR